MACHAPFPSSTLDQRLTPTPSAPNFRLETTPSQGEDNPVNGRQSCKLNRDEAVSLSSKGEREREREESENASERECEGQSQLGRESESEGNQNTSFRKRESGAKHLLNKLKTRPYFQIQTKFNFLKVLLLMINFRGESGEQRKRESGGKGGGRLGAVSYTHLTLPTRR